MKRLLLAITLLLVVCALPAAALEISAEAGFQRRVMPDRVAPFTIRVTSRTPFTGVVEISGWWQNSDVHRIPVELGRNDEVRLSKLLVVPPHPLRIRLLTRSDSEVRSLREDAFIDQRLTREMVHILDVSRNPVPLLGIHNYRLPGNHNLNQKLIYSHITPEQLPIHALGLESVRVILLGDVAYEEIDTTRRAALLGWVARGGVLIVRGGSGARELHDSWLAPYLPLTEIAAGERDVAGMLRIQEETVAPWLTGTENPTRDATGYALTSARQLNQTTSALSLASGWETPYGQGRIRLLAFDPNDHPFRSSQDVPGFLFLPSDAQWFDQRFTERGIYEWYHERIKQLAQLKEPPLVLMGIFLFFYLIIIGPLNFWILSMIRHREYAWFTIPAIVAIFTVAMFATGYAALGKNTLQREIAFVAVDTANGIEQVENYTGIFSAGSWDYDAVFPRNTVLGAELVMDYNDIDEPVTFTGHGPEEAGPFYIGQWSWRYLRSANYRLADYHVTYDIARDAVTVTGDLDLRSAWLARGNRFYKLLPAGNGSYQLGASLVRPSEPLLNEFPLTAGSQQSPVIYTTREMTGSPVAISPMDNVQRFEIMAIYPELTGE